MSMRAVFFWPEIPFLRSAMKSDNFQRMEYILGFGSTHRALKAEELFKNAALPFRLLPVPKALDSACGLVISVEEGSFKEASKVLEKGGLLPRNVYRKEGEEYVKV